MSRKSKSRNTHTRKSRSRSRSKSGGFWKVVENAIVPFALLAAQQTYRRKPRSSKGGRTRKHKK